MIDEQERITELSTGLALAIGYLEGLEGDEQQARVLERLNRMLEGPPQVSLATAIVETATVACERAAQLTEKKITGVIEEGRVADYRALAAEIRGLFGRK